ncbi:carboxymuconolactone decarboxylase family protein [Candidatus Woesearchaeota archaeon]|nr:carboxymuconolactone decarboxylase family protein [Candidatus Woesearchaeota archaeon]
MESMNETLNEVQASISTLSKEYPNQIKAFMGFMGEMEKEGALSVKTKELISVALSVVAHCKWCIAFHVKNALTAGATKDEVMEACFVATLMNGGPSLMYTQYVVKALEEFTR